MWREEVKAKTFLKFFALFILMTSIIMPTVAEENSVFSIEDLEYFTRVWNDYYIHRNQNYACTFFLEDDGQTVRSLGSSYNVRNQEVQYEEGIIPSTSAFVTIYNADVKTYTFSIFDDNLKSNLEKAVIYTDTRVINDIHVSSNHEPSDMWYLTLYGEDILDLCQQGKFTLKLTIDGENRFVDISQDKCPYLFEMVTILFEEQLYADTTYERFRGSEFLPEGISQQREDGIKTDEPYSFREDYDRIDQAAKSLFYVEVYNSRGVQTGSASGFVSFDEHLFVTNQHVIDGAEYLRIWDDNNQSYLLNEVIVSDKGNDIAILYFPDGKKYESLEQNSTTELKRGQPVVTIGSPQGFQNSVAFGNISAFQVINGIYYIQFTAPISHGSSGGCLFDDSGKVIGITSGGIEKGQNLNFAIPIDKVQKLYQQWNKKDRIPLGSRTSWDTVGINDRSKTTATPRPTSTQTPKPTATPKPTNKPTPKPTSRTTQTPGPKKKSNIAFVQKVTDVKTTLDVSIIYTLPVEQPIALDKYFYVYPSNATNKNLEWSVYIVNNEIKNKASSFQYSLHSNELTFKRPGIYTITATSKDGTNKTASLDLAVYPKDMNTLTLPTIWYEEVSGDKLNVSFDIANEEYGLEVVAVEIYVYATDVWGNDIYNGSRYYQTTSKKIAPGKTVRSEAMTISNRSKISRIFWGIHKIKFADDTIITIDDIDYVYYDLK